MTSLIERLLDRSVGQELKHNQKLGFWSKAIDTPHVIQGEDGLDITQAAKLSSSLPPNSTSRDKAGIAWEHVWGRPAPKNIQVLRNKLLEKVRKGKQLSYDEEIWYRLIQTDTDMF